jgi:hypothetical protein
MKVYLAGPMRGIPLYNFPAFHAAARTLRTLGVTVLSPAEDDLADGFVPTPGMDVATPTTFADNFTEDDWHDAMRRDLRTVLDVDAVVVLPGWEGSTGANAEVFVAETVGTHVIDYAALELEDA